MTAAALTTESRQIALELHALIQELEPARWRAEATSALVARIDALRTRCEAWQADFAAASDQSLEAMRARLTEVETLLRASVPRAPDTIAMRESWIAFRQDAMPRYEALAASLRDYALHVPSIRPTNYARNAFHLLAALLGIAVVEIIPRLTEHGFIPVIAIAALFTAWGWGMEISRKVSERANRFLMWVFSPVAHPHEAHHINSATWYVTALLALSLTRSPVLGAVALIVLGVADPCAAIIGKRYGKRRLANGRSFEGAAAFAVSGTIAGCGLLAIAHPEIAAPAALAMSAAAATAGGLTELYLKRVDDNLGIPIAAAAAAWLVSLPFGIML
jgi:dolichol kinase